MDPQEAIQKLLEARAKVGQKVSLYPYASFANVDHLNRLLSDLKADFQQFIANKRILDMGCGDGDMSFLCELLGAKEVMAMDWADTNFNFMQGIRALHDFLHSKIQICSGNLEDMELSFLGRWDLICFLGILYHLPNPIRVLRKLSVVAPQIIASTKVFDRLPGIRDDCRQRRVAYLLEPEECNNDSTNWWVPSEAAVTTMFQRGGWGVTRSIRVDQALGRAEPVNLQADRRLFLIARAIHLVNYLISFSWRAQSTTKRGPLNKEIQGGKGGTPGSVCAVAFPCGLAVLSNAPDPARTSPRSRYRQWFYAN